MKILIVDDETIIVRWLKKNIEELSENYQVVECCRNGQQALDYCMKHTVDVLFVDIRMPIMNGMELLQKLNDNNISIYIVVLSAYDDFLYAREAFKLGAREFILKAEITKQGLKECLDLASVRLSKKVSENMENTASALVSKIKTVLDMADYIDQEQSRLILQECQDLWKFSEYSVSVLDYEKGKNGNLDKKLMELIHYAAEDDGIAVLQVPLYPGIIVLIYNAQAICHFSWIQKMFQTVSSFGFQNVTLGSSILGYRVQSLPVLYQQAKATCEFQKFYLQKGERTFSDMIMDSKFSEIQEEFNRLLRQIKNHQIENINQKIEGLVELFQREKPEVKYVQNMAVNIMLQLYLEIYTEENRSHLEIEEITRLGKAETLLVLKMQMLEKLETYLETANRIFKWRQYSDSVLKIIDYVESHYCDSITLEDVSNAVHLNRTYVSALFKKETGKKFYDYILNYRLIKAAELLNKTNKSIQQISIGVGIPDGAYFSKRFKQQYGQTPLEYRKNKT